MTLSRDRARSAGSGSRVEAEQAVRIVLDHQQPGALTDGQDLVAPAIAEGYAGRVLVRRHRVEELGPLAGLGDRGDRLFERDRHDAVGVHGHVHDFGLGGLEHPESADVARAFGEHHVAWVEEDPCDQVECLLATDGHDDIVGGGAVGDVDPGQGHDFADPLA